MGLADRDYQREMRAGRPPGQLEGAPATKWLLGLCVGIYFGDMIWFKGWLRDEYCFAVGSALGEGRVWEFITFQFLHGSVGHLLFNSIGLYFFGPLIERWWGTRRYLVFYLLCGVAGAVFFSLLTVLGWLPTPGGLPREWVRLVGASAGIYGLLIGTAVIAPHARVHLLFPPVEMSMRTFALGLMGFAVLMILFNWNSNAGGEAGHLGGAILGYFLMRWPWLLGRGVAGGRPRGVNPPPLRQRRPPLADLEEAEEVDRILDKISREGLHSLTAAERERLRAVADSQPGK